MSFRSIGNKPPRRQARQRQGAGKLLTLAACWDHFREAVIPKDAEPETVKRARMVFYAGAAFYQDQILTLGDRCNNGMTDDQGAAHLEELACELDEFAAELAIDVAGKIGFKPGGRVH